MEAYIYQAAFLCVPCGDAVKVKLNAPEGYPDERMYDSGEYPKGPYDMNHEEGDAPDHCDHCGVFLWNPLTDEGYRYIVDQLSNQNDPVSHVWYDAYRDDQFQTIDGRIMTVREALRLA